MGFRRTRFEYGTVMRCMAAYDVCCMRAMFVYGYRILD
jgi:hypothetical protein